VFAWYLHHIPDFDHQSVLLAELVEHLDPQDERVYVDGTLGGAGHASAILARAPRSIVIGIDRDPTAVEAARERLQPHGSHAVVVHGQYADIAEILRDLNIAHADGIVLDLGVSSPQLDHPERGFSFTKEGPLDMRMDPTRGETALELIRSTDATSLADLIRELGEERHAKRIARLIKEAVHDDRIRTTTELAAVIAQAIPIALQRKSKIHPATRTFQALRIAVNAELVELERLLHVFPDVLAPGGRCAIISFHSLEDRLVKNRFRDLAWTTSLPRHLAEQAGERVDPVVTLVTRKAVFASDEEIARNPRARSARLRVCERTSAPNVPATRARS
jgi:16S rRNA (cytosine1402-N4)-methyltransferase